MPVTEGGWSAPSGRADEDWADGRLETWLARPRAAAIALAAMIFCAWIYYAIHSLQARNYIIMTDELQYVKLALNSLDSPVPGLRGEYLGAYNLLYPWLLAPFAIAFKSMPGFYLAIHVVSPLLMCSAAVPVYLLARRLGAGRTGSLAAAALALAGPWLGFSTLVMTENVAYPAFMWALLAITRCVAEPGMRADAWALAGIALAVFARTQLVLLFAVLPLAIWLHGGLFVAAAAVRADRLGTFWNGAWTALRNHRLLLAVLIAGASIALLAALFGSTFGIYDTVFEKSVFPAGALTLAKSHLGTMVAGFGVLAFVLGTAFVIAEVRRPDDAATHAFAVLAALVVFAVMWQASSFNINFAASGLNDRYAFYVIPVIAIAAVVAIERRVRVTEIALATLATFILVRSGYFAGYSGRSWVGAPSSAIAPVINGRLAQISAHVPGELHARGAFGLFAIACGVFAVGVRILVARREVALGLILVPLLLWNVASTRYMFDTQDPWSRPTLSGVRASLKTDSVAFTASATVPIGSASPPDWVDRALPSGQQAALLPVETVPQEGWWHEEYWNRDVERVFRFVNPAQPRALKNSLFQLQLLTLHHDELRLDYATGRFTTKLSLSDVPRFVVQAEEEPRFSLAGEDITRHVDDRAGLPTSKMLRRVEVPYRAEWAIRGLYDDGALGAEGGTFIVYPGAAGETAVSARLEVAIGGRREEVELLDNACVPAGRPLRRDVSEGDLGAVKDLPVRILRVRFERHDGSCRRLG